MNPQALLVPQQGVTRDQKGQADGARGRRRATRSSAASSSPIGRSATSGWSSSGLKAGDAGHRRGAAEGPARAPVGAAPCPPRRRRRRRASTVRESPVAQFFIDRPIFAWVIAILIMLAGALAIIGAAGRAVSGHRAADHQRQRDLSRRLRQDGRGHGHAGHRAAHERPRQPALHGVRRPTRPATRR